MLPVCPKCSVPKEQLPSTLSGFDHSHLFYLTGQSSFYSAKVNSIYADHRVPDKDANLSQSLNPSSTRPCASEMLKINICLLFQMPLITCINCFIVAPLYVIRVVQSISNSPMFSSGIRHCWT